MKQYDIYWAQLPDPVGRRPVLILTRTPALRYLNKALVAEITSQIRGIPVEVLIGKAEGLSKGSAVTLENLQTISMSRLESRIGRLSANRQIEIKRALGFALQWEELQALEEKPQFH